MSDTPRTDATELECRRLEALLPLANLSRQLERELAAKEAELARIREQANKAIEIANQSIADLMIEKQDTRALKAELDTVKGQRDRAIAAGNSNARECVRLRAELDKARGAIAAIWPYVEEDIGGPTTPGYEAAIARLRSALPADPAPVKSDVCVWERCYSPEGGYWTGCGKWFACSCVGKCPECGRKVVV